MNLSKIFVIFYLFTLSLSFNWSDIGLAPAVERVEGTDENFKSSEVSSFIAEVEKLKQGKSQLNANVNPNTNMKLKLAEKYLHNVDPNKAVEEMKHFNYSTFKGLKKSEDVANPGIKILLSYASIQNLISCYLPGLLDIILANPFDISFDYMNISLRQIYVQVQSLDIDKIQFTGNTEQNILHIVFPPLEVALIINTKLNMGAELSGYVKSNIKIDNLIVSGQFYDDFEKEFFKPRMKLMLNDFSVSDSVLNLDATFDNMPELLSQSIIDLFNGTILNALQGYIRNTFVNDGSKILNFLIDKKYDEVYNPFKNDLRVSTLMTRAPLVSSQGLILSMAGDIFNARFFDEFNYHPTPSDNTLMDPHLTSKENVQILLSKTFIRKILDNILNEKLIEVNIKFTNFKYVTLDILNSDVVINQSGISLNNLDVYFYAEKPQFDSDGNPTNQEAIKTINIQIKVQDIDITNGTFQLWFSNLKLFDWKSNIVASTLSKVSNFLSHTLLQIFKNGKYNLPHFNLKPGLSLSNIFVTYGDQYAMLNATLGYIDPGTLYYFI
jgi:hypothetical protein